MANPGPRRIGEIIEAPGVERLQELAESQGECEVIVFDGHYGERVVLRLVVTGFEWAPIDPGMGSTWPIVRITYDNAANIGVQQQRYSGRFVARQVHDIYHDFNHGTMDEG